MHKHSAYRVLAQELERWSSMPRDKLVEHVGKPASETRVMADGEEIAVEIALHWHEGQAAIRIAGVANGPSHWRLERLEESVVVRLR
jgi:hypothetical protein